MYTDRQKFDAAYALHVALARIEKAYTLSYTVSHRSAESLPELNSAATSPLVISALYSDTTMFGNPADNWLERAHHDTLHLHLQADTSAAGEYRVARAQCADIARVAGQTLADIVWADIYGQTLHYAAFGVFPMDQASFVYHYRTTGVLAQF